MDFFSTYGFLIVSMLFQAMLGLSLYIPLMTGQLSLASPGFYALGGYIAAILSTTVFLPEGGGKWESGTFPIIYVLIETVLAGLASALLALLIGFPSLRLRGIYLALATIAFVEIVRVLSLNLEITGKAIGIFGVPQPFINKFDYVVLALPLLIASAWFVYRLERSRVGRAFTALREDELAAAAMGVNPTTNKVLAFVLGAVLAGMVGAISAHFLNTWNARQGTFDVSILVLAYVIIGGSRTFLGPILGGLLLTALPEVLRAIAGIQGLPLFLSQFLLDGRLIIYGLLIVVAPLFYPQGLITPDLFKRRAVKTKEAGA
ncbi:MAG: branched-chain amino acid ABC transporter permease [Anaerolineae bacterium]|nr:branched-chain amino acid ABC transporter permease [Anaerolineae bacterium]MDW8171790.1 branched-chain amino acid ABC transporter permease [Anaerolineae bacterium]